MSLRKIRNQFDRRENLIMSQMQEEENEEISFEEARSIGAQRVRNERNNRSFSSNPDNLQTSSSANMRTSGMGLMTELQKDQLSFEQAREMGVHNQALDYQRRMRERALKMHEDQLKKQSYFRANQDVLAQLYDLNKEIEDLTRGEVRSNFSTYGSHGIANPSTAQKRSNDLRQQYSRMLDQLKVKLKDTGVDAQDLLEEFTKSKNQQVTEELKNQASAYAGEHPIKSTLATFPVKVLTAPDAALESVAQHIEHALDGNTKIIDTNAPEFAGQNWVNTARGKVSEDIDERYESNLPNWAYDQALSLGDNLMSRLIGYGTGIPRLSSAVQGITKFADSVVDTSNRGATSGKAVLTGAWQGANEALGELAGIKGLEKIGPITGKALYDIPINILKQSTNEGIQEIATEMLDIAADRVINQDKSSIALEKQAYINQGMSESEATKQILWDAAKQVANAGIGGALTGGLFGAGAATKSAVSYNAQMNQIGKESLQSGQYDARLRNALQFDPDSEIGQAAIKMVNRDRISNKAAGRFVTQYDRAATEAIQRASGEQEVEDAYRRFASDDNPRAALPLAQMADDRLEALALQKAEEERAQKQEADKAGEQQEIEEAPVSPLSQSSTALWNSERRKSTWDIRRDAKKTQGSETPDEAAPEGANSDRKTELPEGANPAQAQTESKPDGTAYPYTERDGSEWKGEAQQQDSAEPAKEQRYRTMAAAKLPGGEDVKVVDISSTEGGKAEVRLSNGKTAKLDELQFEVPEERTLYSMAKAFPTAKARAFVNHYDGSIGIENYTRAFNVLYEAGYQGKTSLVNAIQKLDGIPREQKAMLSFIYFSGENHAAAAEAKAKQERQPVERGSGRFVNKTGEKLDEAMQLLYMGTAAKTDMTIELRNQIQKDANGAFDAGLSRILLSQNADNQFVTLVHETAEYVREYNPEGMLDVQEAMLGWYAKVCDFETLAAMVEDYRNRYEGQLGKESAREAMGEMTHDAMSALFADEAGAQDFLNWLKEDSGKTATQQKNILQTIVELFDRLLEKINEYLHGHSLPKAANVFAERMDLEQMAALRQMFFEAADHARENYNAVEKRTNKKRKPSQETAQSRAQAEEFAEVEIGGANQKSVTTESGEEVPAERIERRKVKYALNPDFERQYDQWDKKNPRKKFQIGTTSEALKSIGIPNKRIVWDSSKIIKIKAKHPNMTDSVIKQVPNVLETPVLVMRSKQSESRITMFGEVYDQDGKAVLAVIELLPTQNGVLMDEFKVASAYGKDHAQRFINSSEILYVEPNKNRTHTWLKRTGLQLPVGLNQYGPIGRIAHTDENVNSASTASSIRSQQQEDSSGEDAKYSLAYSRGVAPYMDELSYRRYRESGPMSDWNHAMFADDPYTVEGYGDHLYAAFQEELTKVEDLKPKIAEAWNKMIQGNSYYMIQDSEYWEQFTGDEISEEFDPSDIVDSAGAWDNENLVQWFFEGTDLWDGIPGIKTSDGAIVWDPDIIHEINPMPDDDVLGRDLVSRVIKYSTKDLNEINAEYAELLSKWGSIKPGYKPFRHVSVPKQSSDTQKVRRFVRSVMESNAVTDEMVEDLKGEIVKGAMSYTVISDKTAQNAAKKILDEEGVKGAWKHWNSIVNGDKFPEKKDIVLGEYLLRAASEHGDKKEVMRLAGEISELGTRMGQNVQALSLLKKMGGAGRLVYVQRTVDTLNKDLSRRFKKKAIAKIKLNEQLAEDLVNATTQEEIEAAQQELYKDIADQLPPTWVDKWNAWRYLSMLGNPKTHIRNILGNAVFAPVVRIKDSIGAGMEAMFIKDGERTKMALPAGKEYREFAKQDFLKMQDVIRSGGKMNPEDAIRDQRTIFKTRWLETLRKKNFEFMEIEDGWFLKAHYENALAQYLQANKTDLSKMTEGQLERARNYAIQEAQKATFRDASPLANAIKVISHMNKVADVAIEGVLPFKKTPINVLKRGVEYSPAGLLYTLSRGSLRLKRGEITVSEYIDGLASGLTGTGIAAMGALLGGLGWISGGFGDDKEDEFEKLQGRQDYALQIGGITYTVDWMAPSAIPFFIGVELINALRGEYEEVPTRAVVDALLNIAEPMFNLSMLDGLNNTLNAVSFSDNKFLAIAGEVISGYVLQAIPAASGQIARSVDPTRRRTYADKNSPIPESFQTAYQKLFNKIPGLSYLNQPYIDEWGRTDKTGFLWAAFENLVSPGWISNINTSDMEQELLRLYEATGESGVLPGYAAKSITVNGEKLNLTGDEYTQFSEIRGQTAYSTISEIMSSEEYEGMSDAQKVKAVKDAFEFAGAAAKAAVSEYELEGWQQDANEESQEEGASIGESIAHRAATNGAAPEIASTLEEEGTQAAQERIDLMMEACESRDEMRAQKGNVKSAITRAYKKQYIKCYEARDAEGMREIRQQLMELRTPVGKLYTMKDFRNWIDN